MRKNTIQKMCFATVLASVFFLSGEVFADTVLLKNGNVIEGEVTDKNNNYLVIITPGSNGVKTYYLADRVDRVNGELFSHFQVQKNKLSSQKFQDKRGQKDPIVSLTLKDGRVIKGKLVDRNEQYFRLIQDGSEKAEEFLIENIVKAE